jgi:hypothetical protein
MHERGQDAVCAGDGVRAAEDLIVFDAANNYPKHLRGIRFKDPQSGKTLVFLQVELFFTGSNSTCASSDSGYKQERGEDAGLVRD